MHARTSQAPTTDFALFGETITVMCDYGYERSDGLGFSAEAQCGSNDTYSELQPRGFECIPVSCGKYCRFCGGNTKDAYGGCCLAPPSPLEDPEIVLNPVSVCVCVCVCTYGLCLCLCACVHVYCMYVVRFYPVCIIVRACLCRNRIFTLRD
jgi:hypothetical protein